jgi:hypothetical protein
MEKMRIEHMQPIQVKFSGPFSFDNSRNSIFSSPYAKAKGIYLWTIRQKKVGSHLIHYVGETSGFAFRQK